MSAAECRHDGSELSVRYLRKPVGYDAPFDLVTLQRPDWLTLDEGLELVRR